MISHASFRGQRRLVFEQIASETVFQNKLSLIGKVPPYIMLFYTAWAKCIVINQSCGVLAGGTRRSQVLNNGKYQKEG